MSTAQVFRLPDLGEGLTEGEVVEWKVAVGDKVEVDQVVAVVETAKASVDLPSPFAGTVVELHGAEGEVIPVGSPLISIDTGDSAVPAAPPAPASAAASAVPEPENPAPDVAPSAGPVTPATGASGGAAGGGADVFRLPDLGEGLTEGEVVEWKVAVGDKVEVDQVVAVVETAKASVDLPSPFAGTVVELHGAEGEVIAVGAPLISIDTGRGAGTGAPAAAAPAAPAVVRDEKPEASGNVLTGYGTREDSRTRRRRVGAARHIPPPQGDAPPVPGGAALTAEDPVREPAEDTHPVPPPVPQARASGGRAPRVISPLVRRIAAEHGIDLATVTPTAPGGIITRKDVDAAIAGRAAPAQPQAAAPAAAAPAAPAAAPAVSGTRGAAPEDIHIPLRGVRRAIAEKLAASRREIPDATTWVDVDATGLMAAKNEISAIFPDAKVGVFALVARMVVAGLQRFPELNARIDMEAGEIVQLGSINLSFAAQSPRGLMVPVVRGAGQMTTLELAAALRDLTGKAREGTLSPAELTGGTFTINNHGTFGTDGTTPIINHPEAGMLAIGRIIDKPWAYQGEIALRKIAQLSLSFDHRICDGGVAGGFIRYVADCIEKPASMLAHL